MNTLLRDVPTLDLIDLVDRMLDAALAVTTGRLGFSEPAETHAWLMEGNPRALAFFRRELAHQIGATLTWLEPRVSAVFERPGTADGDSPQPNAQARFERIRIIVQIEAETATLRSVLEALNAAVKQSAFDFLPMPSDGQLIDAIIVDKEAGRLLQAHAFGPQAAPVLLAS